MSPLLMTIETVHGVKETVSVDHFIVGPQQVATIERESNEKSTKTSRVSGNKNRGEEVAS